MKNIGGTLYAGTTSGCFRIGKDGLTKDLDGEKIAVLSIFKGTQDILWIGTDGLGVLQEKYDPEFISAIYPPRRLFQENFLSGPYFPTAVAMSSSGARAEDFPYGMKRGKISGVSM